MGRAIVRHPQVFLLDEPLSNLDAKLRVQMRAELARLHQRLGVDDRLRHARPGRGDDARRPHRRAAATARCSSSTRRTSSTTRPANVFVAGFIGSPAMNFLEATLSGDGAAVRVGAAELPIRAASSRPQGDRVLVGIRPEHIAWRPDDDAGGGLNGTST